MTIQMVDLRAQLEPIRAEIDREIKEVLESCQFIGGPKVQAFREGLEKYLGVKHVIPCANGTDALQIAMMAAGLKRGDEVIVPAFTYVATAEVIGLLDLKPVMVDVDPGTFNVRLEDIEKAVTPKTKAIVPVHLFGQSVDLEPILEFAKQKNLLVFEDNAQAIGADYTFKNGTKHKTGTMGDLNSTSFFPSKNLGCYGDGGALMTNDDSLADKARMIANHGQSRQYYHDWIGVNSRLDAFQAAVLNVKLPHLDAYCQHRAEAARRYDSVFQSIPGVEIPVRQHNSTHVFHQYTLKVDTQRGKANRRDALKTWLNERGIPAMIYYPVPLYKQLAFKKFWKKGVLPTTEELCKTVISLPMHSELTAEIQAQIVDGVASFFKK